MVCQNCGTQLAIVLAAQVNGKIASGDVVGAQQAANNAKVWFWVSFGIGIIPWILYGGLMIIGLIAGALDRP